MLKAWLNLITLLCVLDRVEFVEAERCIAVLSEISKSVLTNKIGVFLGFMSIFVEL